jgi:hypothetical protein
MSQLGQLPAGPLVRARPWDVIGAGLAAPMVLWGFLGWFGIAGDSGGGMPGFYSGAGAAGIGLVLAAAGLTANQLLAGRPHDRASPPTAVFLAAAASVVILGGMVAKPDSATIQAGSVAGLLTALTQGAVLIRGWLQGSQKSVKAANVRALNERQAAADLAAAASQPPRYGAGYPGYPIAPGYPVSAGYPAGYPAGMNYPGSGYPTAAGGWPPGGGPPGPNYPPPVPRYPQLPTPNYPQGRPAGPPPGYPAGYPPGPAGYPAGPPPGYSAGSPPGYSAGPPSGYAAGSSAGSEVSGAGSPGGPTSGPPRADRGR